MINSVTKFVYTVLANSQPYALITIMSPKYILPIPPPSLLHFSPHLSGKQFNIPVRIYLRYEHPHESPFVCVTPTEDMAILPSPYVDSSGLVYLPYIKDWKQVYIFYAHPYV